MICSSTEGGCEHVPRSSVAIMASAAFRSSPFATSADEFLLDQGVSARWLSWAGSLHDGALCHCSRSRAKNGLSQGTQKGKSWKNGLSQRRKARKEERAIGLICLPPVRATLGFPTSCRSACECSCNAGPPYIHVGRPANAPATPSFPTSLWVGIYSDDPNVGINSDLVS